MKFHSRKWVKPEDLNQNQTLFSAKHRDIIEIGIEVIKFGKTSVTLKCEVRNIMTKESIITVNSITMVNLDSFGRPSIHGKTAVEYIKDRIKK